jgi:thioredoxin reductase
LAEFVCPGKLESMNSEWDCVVIGGGAAGLSAALVLGRARRRTLVIDAGAQSNLAAHGIGGLLGFDGTPPEQLYALGREQLQAYPSVAFRTGEVTHADGGFAIELADGTRERSRTLLLAAGMDYRTPDIAGLAELWGRSVFHCPFCHGWEVRDAPLAVVGTGERAVHSALLLRGWTDDVVVLGNGPAGLDEAQRAHLAAAGIPVDERVIDRFRSDGGELVAIDFADGGSLARRGALVAATLHPRSDLVTQLGVETAATPLNTAAVVVDAFQRTSVPGVFAAGDLGAGMPQVAAAVASGNLAGAAVMQYLMAENVGLTVPPWPDLKEKIDA